MPILTLEEVANLKAADVDSIMGETVSVSESGKYLERYYETTPRYNYRGGVTGKFWDKVREVADILEQSEEWPFPALAVVGGVLFDGHHRANAALLVKWDKGIPTETSYWSNDADDAYPQDSNCDDYDDEEE